MIRMDRNSPVGDFSCPPPKRKRLQKTVDKYKDRSHLLSGRWDISGVPGRTSPVRLYSKEQPKQKISREDRGRLRENLDLAIKRTEQDAKDLKDLLEGSRRTGRVN